MPEAILIPAGILILFIALSAAGYYLQRVALFPHRYTREETMDLEMKAEKIYSFDEIQSWAQTEIQIDSPFGYKLAGLYFPQAGAQKTIIFSHGITITCLGSAKYMPILRRLGYNILIYDNRFHGLSGGPNCTFGYYEKFDLKAMVDWAFQHLGPDGQVGTHGESLGAAITLQHAAIDPRLSFAIADCPYADLWQLFTFRLAKDYHLSSFPLLYLARWIAKTQAGFDFTDVSPLRDISSLTTPVLFIHGSNDTYIQPQMSQAMYEAKQQGIKELYLAPGAKHAEAFSTNPAEYERRVVAFLIKAFAMPEINELSL